MQCVNCQTVGRLVEDVNEADLICIECGTVQPDSVRDLLQRPLKRRRGESADEACLRDVDRAIAEAETASSITAAHGSRGDQRGVSTTATETVADEVPEFLGPPSDTMLGLQVLRSQFPNNRPELKGVIPVVLKTQIYSIVNDRTEVDRTLDSLRQKNVIRLFKFPTGADDYAAVLTSDFVVQVKACADRARNAGKTEEQVAVFDWFRRSLLPSCTELSISHDELRSCLETAAEDDTDQQLTKLEKSVKTEAQISTLVNAGLLARQRQSGISNAETYWFNIPNIGIVAKGLTKGRAEIEGLLKRRRYPEMLQKELEKRKLQYSVLGMRFHIRDLLGSGRLESCPTTCGPLLKLVKQ